MRILARRARRVQRHYQKVRQSMGRKIRGSALDNRFLGPVWKLFKGQLSREGKTELGSAATEKLFDIASTATYGAPVAFGGNAAHVAIRAGAESAREFRRVQRLRNAVSRGIQKRKMLARRDAEYAINRPQIESRAANYFSAASQESDRLRRFQGLPVTSRALVHTPEFNIPVPPAPKPYVPNWVPYQSNKVVPIRPMTLERVPHRKPVIAKAGRRWVKPALVGGAVSGAGVGGYALGRRRKEQ